MAIALVGGSLLAFPVTTSLAQREEGGRQVRPAYALPDEALSEQGGAFDPSASAGVFIGVSEFVEDESILEVRYAADDAVDLAHLFSRQLGLIDSHRVVLLLSGEPKKPASLERLRELESAGAKRHPATQVKILAEVKEQSSTVGEDGILVVSVATHGFSKEGNYYVLAQNSNLDFVIQTGVPISALDGETSKVKRSLVLLDTCQERLQTGRSVGADARKALPASFSQALQRSEGRVVISGTDIGGYTYDDDEKQNGVFTAALLDGLSGKAEGDERSFITIQTLTEYVDEQVRSWVRGNRGDVDVAGIGVNASPASQTMPLAVNPQSMEADLAGRSDRALSALAGQIIGDIITLEILQDVKRALDSDLPYGLRNELLERIEEVDASTLR